MSSVIVSLDPMASIVKMSQQRAANTTTAAVMASASTARAFVIQVIQENIVTSWSPALWPTAQVMGNARVVGAFATRALEEMAATLTLGALVPSRLLTV